MVSAPRPRSGPLAEHCAALGGAAGHEPGEGAGRLGPPPVALRHTCPRDGRTCAAGPRGPTQNLAGMILHSHLSPLGEPGDVKRHIGELLFLSPGANNAADRVVRHALSLPGAEGHRLPQLHPELLRKFRA